LLLAFAAALVGFGWVKGAHHVQSEWTAANLVLERAQSKAINDRLASNEKLFDKQAAINKTIIGVKDHEIATLTARVNSADRMRVGKGICGGPAAPAQAPSASSGDSPDSSGGLVREDVDRDIRALIVAVETDLATGRACQSFVRENGLEP
jgi:hypothetical protein